jgi:hypothetical protein
MPLTQRKMPPLNDAHNLNYAPTLPVSQKMIDNNLGQIQIHIPTLKKFLEVFDPKSLVSPDTLTKSDKAKYESLIKLISKYNELKTEEYQEVVIGLHLFSKVKIDASNVIEPDNEALKYLKTLKDELVESKAITTVQEFLKQTDQTLDDFAEKISIKLALAGLNIKPADVKKIITTFVIPASIATVGVLLSPNIPAAAAAAAGKKVAGKMIVTDAMRSTMNAEYRGIIEVVIKENKGVDPLVETMKIIDNVFMGAGILVIVLTLGYLANEYKKDHK